MRRLINVFWNAKTERHEVAVAEGKYREANIAKLLSPKANIAKGKYHEVSITK